MDHGISVLTTVLFNKMEIKDGFSIVVIDELLDGLNGVKISSKPDLRSGYKFEWYQRTCQKHLFRCVMATMSFW